CTVCIPARPAPTTTIRSTPSNPTGGVVEQGSRRPTADGLRHVHVGPTGDGSCFGHDGRTTRPRGRRPFPADPPTLVRVETATDPMVGRLLGGRYLIGRRIARGGMATVYEATDNRLQRVVAVKVMHAALASDADFVKRFRREARSAARLSHPNIVAVFDQGSDGETVYLTMEYVAGRTLRHVLHESGPMAPLDALELIDPILRALSAAHQAGLVHRDVKPENVLIGEDGTVKVADFGVARGVGGATNTATQGLLIGTVS